MTRLRTDGLCGGKRWLAPQRLPDRYRNPCCLKLPIWSCAQHSLDSMAELRAHRQGLRDLRTAWTWAGAKGSRSPPHLERSYCSIVEGSVTTHSRGSSGQA